MKCIVGLGNYEEKYRYTRHNAGFDAVDAFTENSNKKNWQYTDKAQSFYTTLEIEGKTVICIKPQTYMNNSGKAVGYAVRKHHIQPSNILVVHDDITFSVGEYKFSFNKGTNGHNGVQSVIDALGTRGFWRLRIGIGEESMEEEDKKDFVLSNFSKSEKEVLNALIRETLTYEIQRWIAGKIQ